MPTMKSRRFIMIARVTSLIESASRKTILVSSLGMLIIIAVLDYASGLEFASSIFYLVPVALVAWRFEFRVSGAMALVAATTWIQVMTLLGTDYPSLLVATWDGFSRFLVFLAFAALLSHLRTLLMQAREMALTDHLTGVANSRYFNELAEQELEHCRRHERPFTLAYVDIDNFKSFNDEMGHSGGDRVLQAVASALQKSIRTVDQMARQGGDEFMLFLHETEAEQAAAVLEQVHARTMALLATDDFPVSLSIGGVTWETPPETLDAAIQAADRVMYRVKRIQKGSVRHHFASDLGINCVSDYDFQSGNAMFSWSEPIWR